MIETYHPIYRDAITRYTDGTPVQPGDRVTVQQSGGGVLPPGEPVTGTAVITPENYRSCPEDALVIIVQRDGYTPARYVNANGHIVTRVA